MQTPAYPLRNLRILAQACLLTACSGDAASPPPAELEPRFDVTLTMRYLIVGENEACDGVTVFTGEPRDGEFQYRIEVERGDKRVASMESDNYGSALGYSYSRLPGELINFANRDFKIESLDDGETVTINLFGTEWDEFGKDELMDNRRTQRVIPSSLGWNVGTFPDRMVTVPLGGSAWCELSLVYDMSVTSRLVPPP